MSNDLEAAERVAGAFRRRFCRARVVHVQATSASEDFGAFGAHWKAPSVFWFIGGTDPAVYQKAQKAGRLQEIPTNHNARFAPLIHPTLETGVAALMTGARAWLSPEEA